MKKITLLLLTTLTITTAFSQEAEPHEEHHSEDLRKWKLGLILETANIPAADGPNLGGFFVAPAWTFEAGYNFNHKWSLVLSNTITVSTFLVETNDGVLLERENPYTLTLVPTYEITEHWGVFVGFGAEFDKNENFFVFKGGLDYLVFKTDRWSTKLLGYYESKGGEFGAWGVGIGFFRYF